VLASVSAVRFDRHMFTGGHADVPDVRSGNSSEVEVVAKLSDSQEAA